jgi:hypothetical protein
MTTAALAAIVVALVVAVVRHHRRQTVYLSMSDSWLREHHGSRHHER